MLGNGDGGFGDHCKITSGILGVVVGVPRSGLVHVDQNSSQKYNKKEHFESTEDGRRVSAEWWDGTEAESSGCVSQI